MVREDPLWQDGNDYPARLDRQFLEDVFDTEGVIRTTTPGALAVSQRAAGANMSVDVAAGRAVIKGDDEANQGAYRVISTAIENLPIGAAPGSDSRIDLVIARVRDASVTGGVSSDWILEVIPGVVAAAPVAPAVPNTAIPLAQVLVAVGTASITAGMITDRRATAGSAAYAPRGLKLRRAANQSIPNATVTAVSWDTEDRDDYAAAAVPVTSITIPAGQGGWKHIDAEAFFTNHASGIRQLRLLINGVIAGQQNVGPDVALGVPQRPAVSGDWLLAAGDVVRVDVYQDTGAALNMLGRLNFHNV